MDLHKTVHKVSILHEFSPIPVFSLPEADFNSHSTTMFTFWTDRIFPLIIFFSHRE